jgi:hypothetical protein
MPGVNPSNRRLRQSNNLTNYGAANGGFGLGIPGGVGISYHQFRLFSRVKAECCGADPVKVHSYSKCCNAPGLREDYTTIVVPPPPFDPQNPTIYDVPGAPFIELHSGKNWLLDGNSLIHVVQLSGSGNAIDSALIQAQHNISHVDSDVLLPVDNTADPDMKYYIFHYDVINQKIVYVSLPANNTPQLNANFVSFELQGNI